MNDNRHITIPTNGDSHSRQDYVPKQPVKWCPGCGNHSALAAVQTFLAEADYDPEKCVFVSGIGCSSRFPYYINTYGFHSIHGRAPAIATGIKIANPNLSVWVVTGDGDALSIGGNHFIHTLRRNLDINIILLNNRIYGLTKGQYSPTSEFGKVTKSSPYGAPDQSLKPVELALGAKATFVARTLDLDPVLTKKILKQAVNHRGTSFIEVFQNCSIFNQGAFDYIRMKNVREESRIVVEHGKPLIFGTKRDKGLKLRPRGAEIVDIDIDDPRGVEKADITVFDAHNPNHAVLLTKLPPPPAFPTPMGILFTANRPTAEDTLQTQARQAKDQVPQSRNPDKVLHDLFRAGETWEKE